MKTSGRRFVIVAFVATLAALGFTFTGRAIAQAFQLVKVANTRAECVPTCRVNQPYQFQVRMRLPKDQPASALIPLPTSDAGSFVIEQLSVRAAVGAGAGLGISIRTSVGGSLAEHFLGTTPLVRTRLLEWYQQAITTRIYTDAPRPDYQGAFLTAYHMTPLTACSPMECEETVEITVTYSDNYVK